MTLFSRSGRAIVVGFAIAVLIVTIVACDDPVGSNGNGDDSGDTTGDDPPVPVDATMIPDANLRQAIADEVGVELDELNESHLAQITQLYGAEYDISDLTGIGNLENLRDVEFWDNNISDLTPLLDVSGLEWLEVTGNPLTYNAISIVTPTNFPNLKYLFVSEYQGELAGNASEIIALFGAFSPLRGIGIEKVTTFMDEMATDFAGLDLTELIILWLRGNNITDVAMDSIGTLDTLEELRIDGNTGVTSIAPLADEPMLTELHRIHIRTTGVTDLAPLETLRAAGVFNTDSARVDVRNLGLNLWEGTDDRVVIDALIAAGVSVEWEQGNNTIAEE